MIAPFVAAVVVAAAAPAPSRAPSAACPRSPAHIVDSVTPQFPDGARPTNPRVSFLVDSGSDGRVRRIALTESSGDAAVDAAALAALQQYRLAPPSAGCMSVSTAWARGFDLPPESIISPSPGPATSPPPIACVSPFPRLVNFPLPPRREVPGTAIVDVALDTAGRVTGVHLVKPTGNTKTNYAATIIARNAKYRVERIPGCAATPTTYRLELTFH